MERRVRRPGGVPERRHSGNSKRLIFRRTVCLMLICGIGLFVPLLMQLWDISVVKHEAYRLAAAQDRSMEVEVSAKRGNLADDKGNVLAMSATVYKLILSPRDLVASVSEKDYQDEEGNLDQAAYDQAVEQKQQTIIRDLMALLPDLDEEKLAGQVTATKYAYREVKINIEEEEAETLRAYISENKTSHYLYLTPTAKRYYPYASVAAHVLGFVNSAGGAYGLESNYESLLRGVSGRVVTEKTATGVEMYSSYSDFIDAIDGYDLNLTLDATIQSYVERTLAEGIEEYDVQNGAFCIVMEPKTGKILAMASAPTFDPNQYSTVLDERLQAQMEAEAQQLYEEYKTSNTENLTDEELRQKAESTALGNAQLKQWWNKCIKDTYEPGSTFKALVLAAALEEGVVSESDTFTCTGSYVVNGRAIGCSKREGHGTQTLAEAVQNSCNPAFMMIGERLGAEKFYDYFEAYGFNEITGIDLPGEELGINWGRDYLMTLEGKQSLATASFGQRFTITPLQMITAFASTINGGNLVKPYVVDSMTTGDGTVVSKTEPETVRQIISTETSQRVRTILESVVSEGTGNNAYQAGYRIGGKTGSSETDIGAEDSPIGGRTIVSFMGFAPADDPQVLVLLAYDWPKEATPGAKRCTTGVYISGGNMAAPKAGELIADVLDYMGVEKQYTEAESAAVDVSTPGVVGKSVADAAAALEKKNLKYRTVGEGETVTAQIPAKGASVPGGSTVILYLGDAVPEAEATVPNVVGLSYEAARSKLEELGLFMRATGATTYYGNTTKAEAQSLAAGEAVALGTVVEVTFSSVMEDGAVELE